MEVDAGELGTLPTRKFNLLRISVASVCFGSSALLFLSLLSGICPVNYVSSVGGWMTALLLLGTSFVYTAPLLWAQPGRLTYLRCTKVNFVLLPRTLKARLCAYLLVVDALVVPLAVGVAVFRNSFVGFVLSLPLYPPPLFSSVPFYLLFWCLPLIAVAANAYHFFFLTVERSSPLHFTNKPNEQKMAKRAVGIIAGLMLPAYSLLLSALPCDPGLRHHLIGDVPFHLRYAPSTRCLSTAHRVHVFFAIFFFLVLQVQLDISVGTLHRLIEPHGCPSVEEPSMDAFFLGVMRFLRLLTIVLVTASPSALHCFLIGMCYLTLFIFLLMGRFASNIQCMQKGYTEVLAAVGVSCVSCAAIAILFGCGAFGAALWLILLILLVAVVARRFYNQYGWGFEAPEASSEERWQ